MNQIKIENLLIGSQSEGFFILIQSQRNLNNIWKFMTPRLTLVKSLLCSALALSISTALSAATPWILCEQCQPADAQFAAVQSGHMGEIAIFSLRNNFAAKFENEQRVVGQNCEPTLRGAVPKPGAPGVFRRGECTYEIVATAVSLSGAELDLKALLQQMYAANGGSLKSVVNVSAEQLQLPQGPITAAPNGSAIDFVNNANFRAQVRTAAWAEIYAGNFSINLGNLANAVVGAGSVLLLGADGTKITFKITFGDGSKVVLVYTETDIPDSEAAFSAENRDIMTADNIYRFLGGNDMANELSLQNFLANAQIHGVRINTGDVLVGPLHATCRSEVTNGEKIITCSRN